MREARESVGRIVYRAFFTAILGHRVRVDERRWTEKDILFILPPRSPPLEAPAMQLDLICEYAPVPQVAVGSLEPILAYRYS